MRKISIALGLIAGIVSIILWIIISFFNPYAPLTDIKPIINTFIMLFLPACLAILSSIKYKKTWMLIAFIWSLPISAYCALTPSIFSLFGLTSFVYLLSYLLMPKQK